MAPSAALADLKLGPLTGFARARSSPAAENYCFSPISSPNSPFFCALCSPLSRHCGRLPNDQLSFGVATRTARELMSGLLQVLGGRVSKSGPKAGQPVKLPHLE